MNQIRLLAVVAFLFFSSLLAAQFTVTAPATDGTYYKFQSMKISWSGNPQQQTLKIFIDTVLNSNQTRINLGTISNAGTSGTTYITIPSTLTYIKNGVTYGISLSGSTKVTGYVSIANTDASVIAVSAGHVKLQERPSGATGVNCNPQGAEANDLYELTYTVTNALDSTTVDWGDGTINTYAPSAVNATHIYAAAAKYWLVITNNGVYKANQIDVLPENGGPCGIDITPTTATVVAGTSLYVNYAIHTNDLVVPLIATPKRYLGYDIGWPHMPVSGYPDTTVDENILVWPYVEPGVYDYIITAQTNLGFPCSDTLPVTITPGANQFQILQPAGGELYNIGDTMHITWSGNTLGTYINIFVDTLWHEPVDGIGYVKKKVLLGSISGAGVSGSGYIIIPEHMLVRGFITTDTITLTPGQFMTRKLKVADSNFYHGSYLNNAIRIQNSGLANMQLSAIPTITNTGTPIVASFLVANPVGSTIINWGDGSADTTMLAQGILPHTYNTAATYTIELINNGDTIRQTEIVQVFPSSPFHIVNPMGGGIAACGSADTLTIISPLQGAITYYLIDSTGAIVYTAVTNQMVYNNGYIKKYLFSWPSAEFNSVRLVALINNSTTAGADTSNVFSIECRRVSGQVYYDFNGNSQFDVNEYPYTLAHFNTSPDNVSTIMDWQGNYTLTGFSVAPNIISLTNTPPYATAQPALYNLTLANPGTVAGNDFVLQPNTSGYNLTAELHRLDITAAWPADAYIFVTNMGPNPSMPTTLLYYYDTLQFSYNQANIPQGIVQDGVILFNIPALMPLQNYIAHLAGIITQPVGAQITESCHLTVQGDLIAADNADTLTFECIGGVDPNNIIAQPDTVFYNGLQAQYIDYVINFQNTGTGPALNIRVSDTIADYLDINTIEILSASHNYTYIIKPNRVVEFMFNNIMLPDSGYNEPASHGYIIYKAKPLPTLLPGMVINSTANIYFDYNPPVQTNIATVNIAEPLGVTEHQKQLFNLFPNPTTCVVYVSTKTVVNTKVMLRIFAADGRMVYTENYMANNAPHAINVNSLANGLYTIHIITGQTQTTQKLVIDK